MSIRAFAPCMKARQPSSRSTDRAVSRMPRYTIGILVTLHAAPHPGAEEEENATADGANGAPPARVADGAGGAGAAGAHGAMPTCCVCSRVLITSSGFVTAAATVPAPAAHVRG